MKTVLLDANEFLSFYTGRLLGESFDIVKSAVEKLYGGSSTLSPIVYQESFIKFINNTRPDLCDAIQNIGPFTKTAGSDIMKDIETYVNKFKKEIGSDTVEINVDKLQAYSQEQDDLCL